MKSLLLGMWLISTANAREFEFPTESNVIEAHVCNEKAFTALEIALAMPKAILSWKDDRLYLSSSVISCFPCGIYAIEGDDVIRLPDLCYDKHGLPYMKLSFLEFWRECQRHLSSDELNNPPPGVYFMLKLYEMGTEGV